MGEFDFQAGDRVRIYTKTATYEGIVMPRPETGGKEHVTIKLDSGYNIGVLLGAVEKVEKLAAKSEKRQAKSELKFEKGKPEISIVTTGGTITSKVDYKTGGAYPLTKPEELLEAVPELAKVVSVKNIQKPFSIFSEDMTPENWGEIAEAVAKELNSSGVHGVIVTHGTDTLHYTAAALSFMLKGLHKPVALVGAQRSVDRGSFDGNMNLVCAAHYCLSDIAEVAIVMHGKSDDDYCIASRGTKVRKMHTSRRDTFRPINDLPLAKIFPDGNLVVTNTNHKKRTLGKVEADTKFENKTALIYYYPGLSPDILDYYVKQKYKGVIIAGTGFGHVLTQKENKKMEWLSHIKDAVGSGMFVGMASQAIYGTTDPLVYSSARNLQDAGVVYLKDMLAETAYVKLGCVLAHHKSPEEIKKQMLTNIAGEFNERIEPQSFLY